MQTEQIDEIREMFINDDGSCKLSRSDVLRIVDKLTEQNAAQQIVCSGRVPHTDVVQCHKQKKELI